MTNPELVIAIFLILAAAICAQLNFMRAAWGFLGISFFTVGYLTAVNKFGMPPFLTSPLSIWADLLRR